MGVQVSQKRQRDEHGYACAESQSFPPASQPVAIKDQQVENEEAKDDRQNTGRGVGIEGEAQKDCG